MKTSASERIFDFINVIVLGFVVLLTLYPMIYIFNSSISDPLELMKSQSLMLWPKGFQLEAYKKVLESKMVFIGFKNTLIYVIGGTSLSLLLTSLGAYALSRKDLYGKKGIMMFITITMFFSGGMIPLFLLVQNLHMIDTRWAIILPGVIQTFNLILMRTAFSNIPDSLIESAKIDGGNEFLILFRIILPLSMPIISVMLLYYGVGYWNDFMNAILYIRNRDLYPIQLVLREILLSNSTEGVSGGIDAGSAFQIGETIKYATIIVSTVPILIVYPFIQKYFVQGALVGAVKE